MGYIGYNRSTNQQKKEAYLAPQVEIIEMETEGVVLSASPNGGVPDIGDGGGAFS